MLYHQLRRPTTLTDTMRPLSVADNLYAKALDLPSTHQFTGPANIIVEQSFLTANCR
jgi:hypothetical protein